MTTKSTQDSAYSYAATTSFLQQNFALIVMAILFFVAGFFMGSIWTENTLYKKGGTPTAAVGAGTGAAAPAGETGPTAETLATMPELTDSEHSRGNPDAKITLVEYSDFECPFCAKFHPTMKQVLAEYGDDVRWVYRHYPLPFHPNAQKAAEASECVAKLAGNDAFWVYADTIIDKQESLGNTLTPAAIQEAAQATGVDMAAFKTCLDSGEMAQAVTDDMNGGSSAGVSGTPGTVIVTKDGPQSLIPGAYPFADIKVQIDTYLK